jgi:multicomponent Na+:H+ antiporter subunit F
VTAFLYGVAIFVAVLIGANFYRVFLGPTIYDRLLGVGAIGTNAVLLLALIGFVYARPEGFLDLAITYAVLNFIGVVAVAKFLDERLKTPPGAPAESTPGMTRDVVEAAGAETVPPEGRR